MDLILYTEMNQQKSDLKHFQAPPTGFFSRSDYKKKKMDMEKKKVQGLVCLNKALGNVPCNDIESYNETGKP